MRLCFLKGFFQESYDHVGYVSADQLAESVGLKVEEIMDPGFTDYESAIMFKLKYKDLQFSIGGCGVQRPSSTDHFSQ